MLQGIRPKLACKTTTVISTAFIKLVLKCGTNILEFYISIQVNKAFWSKYEWVVLCVAMGSFKSTNPVALRPCWIEIIKSNLVMKLHVM